MQHSSQRIGATTKYGNVQIYLEVFTAGVVQTLSFLLWQAAFFEVGLHFSEEHIAYTFWVDPLTCLVKQHEPFQSLRMELHELPTLPVPIQFIYISKNTMCSNTTDDNLKYYLHVNLNTYTSIMFGEETLPTSTLNMEIVYIPKFSHLFTRIYGITGRNTTT
jgi:hypothetical protein